MADNLVLIFMVFFLTLPAAYSYDGVFLEYFTFYQLLGQPIVIFLKWSSKTGSIYLTLFVTAERYIAVSRPFKASTLCTKRNAKIGIVMILLFTLIYNIPKLLYYKMYNEGYDVCMRKIMPIGERTELYTSRVFIDVYVLGMYFIIIYIFPLTSLFVLNSFLISMVRKSYRQRAEMGGVVKSSERTTEKIIGIVTAFIVLETPAIIVNLIVSQKDQITTQDLNLLNMIYILSAINSVINFYIYCLVARDFRQKLIRMLQDWICSGRRRSSSSVGDNTDFSNYSVRNQNGVKSEANGTARRYYQNKCHINTVNETTHL